MKKIKNPLILLALGATALCGLAAIKIQPKEINSVNAEIPSGYYSACEGLSGSSLQSKLLEINKPKSTSYDWSRYEAADEALDDSTSILSLYTRHNIKKNGHCGSYSWSTWNREHIWTQSKYPASDTDNHNIFACEGQINNYRGNLPFNEVAHTSGNTKQIFGHDTGCYWTSDYFEPCDPAKGEVARSVMYGTVMYSYTMTQEIKSIELALKWHLEHPNTERDTRRNDIVYGLQGNRNPFVDHRSYACKIWGNTSNAAKTVCDQYNGWVDDPTPTKELTDLKVTGSPSKTTYTAGESFETAGLTVTAYYSDSTTENVTSKVTVSPNPLTEGTTSVTLTYSTKSVSVSGITVNSKPAVNYGTLENPLTVSQAKVLIGEECISSGKYTEQEIYCRGKVGSIIDDYPTYNRKKIYISDTSTTSTAIIESLNMTSDQYELLETNDEIIFHGYGFNNNGTHQFKYKDSYNPTLDRNITKEAIIPVTSVTITNTKNDFYIGQTCQISATVLPSNATNKTLTYSSNNTGVASVNSSGLVTFKAAGNATITVSSNNGKTATITFNVTKAPVHVTQINVSLPSISYYVGDTADLIYEVLPKDADNKNVTFESTNTSVATVNSEGEVNFIKAGSVTLKVISSDVPSVYGQVTVTVSERPAEDILVTDIVVNDSLSILVNEESQISYQVIPTNATDKTVSWSSNNSKVATVDEDGVVKGLSEGTAEITVTANDAGHVSKTINVEVTKPVEVIKVSQINVPSSITVKVNENANIEYEVLPENATDKSVTISSTNDEIATINGTKVVGVSEGTTEITILSNDGGATASIPVTVTKGEEPVTKTIAEIAVVNLPDKTTYEIGEDFDQTGLVVNVNYTDGTEEDISSQVSLSEVDTSVSGTKTVEITYKTNYKTSFQVIVLEASVLSITMEKTPAKMNYFADEPLNTYGLVIKATMSDDSVIANVADMCTYTYDFATSNKVLISFSGKQLTMFVTLENVVQEKPVQHKAADFAYVFIEKLETKEPASVTQPEWDALQYYYNKLDTASKEFLKNYKVSSNGNGEVSAEVPEVDALKEFATKYDAIYSARKADGFTDFIGRASVQPIPGPTPTPTPSSDNKTLIIVIIVISVVAVALIAIIIPVEVKRSKRSKKNA